MALAASLNNAQNQLSELISKASQRKRAGMEYQGEITPLEAYEYLVKTGGILVDVRTVPEWQFVGVPDLSGCKGEFAAISWKVYPDMAQNGAFVDQFAQTVPDKDMPVFMMCRGGGRSLSAAVAMTQAGYSHCFNVATGFEGDADATGHRGRTSGWQGSGLPWKH